MIEVQLDVAEPVFQLSFDPVRIFPDEQSGKLGETVLIAEQV